MALYTVFRLISFLSIGITTVLVVVMLLTFRKERRIGVASLLISIGLSLIMLPIFILLSGARLNLLIGLPLLAIGLLVGILRGFATRLYLKDGHVMGRHSLLFLAGWGLSLVLAQILNLTASRLLASVGLMPMFLSTGTQVGITSNLLLRRLFRRVKEAAI
ncbi:MAG: hypothetical protein MUQ30_05000 [Anaerolineae bacterium]|nr:hypothetical protein [Anaerolineae bacterium]